METENTPFLMQRRQWLHGAGGAAFALSLSGVAGMTELMAAADKKGAAKREAFNRFPRMVQESFVQRVKAVEAKGLLAKADLKNKQDAEAYVKELQKKIATVFSPFPKKKSPLNARITGTVERDSYRIEKLIFESRPGFLVTANLYVPKGIDQPMPAVVGTCGHSHNGKAAGSYQSYAQGLAKQGYVVLIYDPVGQGERLQYAGEDLKSLVGGPTTEHAQAGNQQFLIGEFFGTWRAWDGIRALDYLLTRKEVDGKRIGVTGNSGGGTMTTWLCGVESRWAMAAPSCFVTTWRHNMENELPQDTEQCPPGTLALGLDHDDFLAAMAPKPIVIMAQEKDFFDARGSAEAYERLKNLYRLLGKEQNIVLHTGPQTHGYSQENREAMYAIFNRASGLPAIEEEPEIQLEEDKTLQCTATGQVKDMKSRSVFSFTAASALQQDKKRKELDLKGVALLRAVKQVLNLPKRVKAPRVRIFRTGGSRDYSKKYYINYGVETDPGIMAVCTMLGDERMHSRPPQAQGDKRALLYVSHLSADAELRDEPLLRELIKKEGEDTQVFACDVRGVGDSRPGFTSQADPYGYYGADYMYAIYSMMFNQPYLGGRTHDVLCVLDWMASRGYDNVHLVGKGWGALPATFAALYAENVKQVTLKNSLTSYLDVSQEEFYKWPLSSFLPGVLSKFDLPECYAELKAKKLKQVEPWGASMGV
ncbi:MAG: prolyl oligopeptidase family serine peptidase [Verrucomicrobiales bacterium]|nr:prolyl oligopeptidase family serine peptidase [Verrucomicrobiales bacterium]